MRDRLDLQFQDTYYRIVLQAHNELGFSSESSIIIKTKKGKQKSFLRHEGTYCPILTFWYIETEISKEADFL